MSGRKGIFVRRQNRRPAVWLNLARPSAPARVLQHGKDKDSRRGSGSACGDCEKAFVATESGEDQTDGIPEPPIATARRRDHHNAKPSRSAPAMNAAHQPMIVGFDLVPNRLAHCHGVSSSTACGSPLLECQMPGVSVV